MRYASIRDLDLTNGEGIGVSLFVQGCPFHCYNCFNPNTWDFDGGKEWTYEIKQQFLSLVDRPYITRVSILGGEPIANQNFYAVYELIEDIKEKFPSKVIWLYTGNKLSMRDFDQSLDLVITNRLYRMCDVIVDGPYIDEQRDVHLSFRGSKNQRLIDMKETIKQGKIITLLND